MKLITRDLRPGFALPAVTRKLTTEDVLTFCLRERELDGRAVDEKNIHTSEEVARSHGLRGVVAPGVQTMPFIWQLLREAFGHRWTRDGKLAVTFTNMVCGGDSLVTRALVRAPRQEESPDRLYLDVFMENHLGEKVIVGQASLPLDE